MTDMPRLYDKVCDRLGGAEMDISLGLASAVAVVWVIVAPSVFSVSAFVVAAIAANASKRGYRRSRAAGRYEEGQENTSTLLLHLTLATVTLILQAAALLYLLLNWTRS